MSSDRITVGHQIVRAFDFVLHETAFTLGEIEMQRKTGYPMGGSFSEPATLVDLQDDVLQFYTKRPTAVHCGWYHPDLSPEETVCGVQHVDDALIGSAVLCSGCLESGLRKLWPSDDGVSVEETGLSIWYLQAHIVIRNPTVAACTLLPNNPNADFAYGLSPFQGAARLGLYYDTSLTPYTDLRQFVIGRLLTYNAIL